MGRCRLLGLGGCRYGYGDGRRLVVNSRLREGLRALWEVGLPVAVAKGGGIAAAWLWLGMREVFGAGATVFW